MKSARRPGERDTPEAAHAELARAQRALEAERAKYAELFDKAPVGYVILGADGLIEEANLTAAHLLGVRRRQLTERPFTDFIAEVDADVYHLHHRELERNDESYACEVRLRRSGTAQGLFWAHLEEHSRSVKSARVGFALTFSDVDERVGEASEIGRLNAELRQAQRLLEETEAIGGLGGWDFDVARRTYTWTEQMHHIFGVGPDHDPNDATGDIGAYTPESATLLARSFAAAVGAGVPYDLELEFVRADGTTILLRSVARPVLLNEAVVHIVGTTMDITQRKRAEEALRRRTEEVERQQAFLTTLLETIPSPVFYKDLSGVYLGCNRAFEMLIGRGRGAIVGKTALELGPPELAEIYEVMDRRALEEGEAQVDEWPLRAADGSVRDVMFSIGPFGDAGGQAAGLIGVALDITARKQAEEAMRQLGDRLSLATRAGGVGVWDWDLAADTLTWDEQMFALSGVAPEHVGSVMEAWQNAVHPDDRARRDAAVQAALSGHAEYDVEFRVVWPDGSVHTLQALAQVQRDASGQPLRMTGTNWDITERKRLEEDLRSSAENFRGYFEAVDDVIVVASPDGRIVYANPAVTTVLGYSAEEATAMHVLDLNPRDRRTEAERVFAAMLRGELDGCPLPLETRSGALVPAETRVWKGRWNGQDCIFGVSKDLSAEQEALQKFESLFRRNPALMAVNRLTDLVFTDVNDAFLGTLGYSRDEVLGHTSVELGIFPRPEEQQAVAAELQATGRVSGCELEVRRRDGTVLDGVFSGEIIESQGRKYFLTVMVDQTERRRAEDQLRLSQTQLAHAVEGSGIGLWDWHVQTGEAVFNERWAAIVGYALDELAPVSIATWTGLCHPDDLRRSQEALERHFSGQSDTYECQVRMRHRDGDWVWVLDRGRVWERDREGRPLRMTGIHLAMGAEL